MVHICIYLATSIYRGIYQLEHINLISWKSLKSKCSTRIWRGHSLFYPLFQWRHPLHKHTHIFRLPFQKVPLIRLFPWGACANMLFAKGNVSAISNIPRFVVYKLCNFCCYIPCKRKECNLYIKLFCRLLNTFSFCISFVPVAFLFIVQRQ